jgi:hypothetical protein
MSGYAVVEVAIGLSFVFVILSVFATSIVEAVAGLLSYRAKLLEDWLAHNLMADPVRPPAGRGARIAGRARDAGDAVVGAVKGEAPTPEQEAAKHILGHPVVYAMTKGTSRPSYIPPERFVSALLGRGGETRAKVFAALGSDRDAKAKTQKVLDALPPGEIRKGLTTAWSKADGDVEKFRPLADEWYAAAPAVAAKAKALIDDLPDGPMRRAMRSLWIEAGTSAAAFRTEAENWFDQAMQRLSGSYKRRTQVWLWIVGFAFALLLDVDSVRIANALWQDQTLRQVVADQAQNAPSAGIDPKGAADKLSTLGLPLGWDGWPSGFTNWFSTAVGLVLTSAAVSLGAPFWFDSLSKLANLRNSGPKPKSEELATS